MANLPIRSKYPQVKNTSGYSSRQTNWALTKHVIKTAQKAILRPYWWAEWGARKRIASPVLNGAPWLARSMYLRELSRSMCMRELPRRAYLRKLPRSMCLRELPRGANLRKLPRWVCLRGVRPQLNCLHDPTSDYDSQHTNTTLKISLLIQFTPCLP